MASARLVPAKGMFPSQQLGIAYVVIFLSHSILIVLSRLGLLDIVTRTCCDSHFQHLLHSSLLSSSAPHIYSITTSFACGNILLPWFATLRHLGTWAFGDWEHVQPRKKTMSSGTEGRRVEVGLGFIRRKAFLGHHFCCLGPLSIGVSVYAT